MANRFKFKKIECNLQDQNDYRYDIETEIIDVQEKGDVKRRADDVYDDDTNQERRVIFFEEDAGSKKNIHEDITLQNRREKEFASYELNCQKIAREFQSLASTLDDKSEVLLADLIATHEEKLNISIKEDITATEANGDSVSVKIRDADFPPPQGKRSKFKKCNECIPGDVISKIQLDLYCDDGGNMLPVNSRATYHGPESERYRIQCRINGEKFVRPHYLVDHPASKHKVLVILTNAGQADDDNDHVFLDFHTQVDSLPILHEEGISIFLLESEKVQSGKIDESVKCKQAIIDVYSS